MMAECLHTFYWYYGVSAALLYGLAYLMEKVLDIPLWNHECPGVAHIELKRLVQKIIDEILSLPDWLNLGNNHSPGRQAEEALPYFDPKKYEELLATAVINKAINLFKNDKNLAERSSSGIHTDSELDSNHNNSRKELLSLQLARGTENYFLSGESSPTSQPMSSEFSLDRHEANALYSSLNSQDYLNDYIQNHKVPLPEISSESNNEDDLQSLTSIGTDGTWEENWLFKKRKLKTDATVSIAMLVPSPTEEIKALIGDQNVDEVSDLSETESHTENGDEELLVSINGHYSLPDFNRTDLEPDSLTSNHSLPAYEPLVSEAKNTFIFINDQNLIGKTMESSETSSLTTASDVEKFIEENNNIIETFEAPADLIAIAPTTTIEAETLETGTNENTDQENNLVEIRNVKNSIVTTAELILAPPEDFQPTPTARTSILVEPKVTEMASSSAENKLDNGNDATNNESNLGISVVSDEEDQIFSDSFVDGKQPAAEEDEVVHLIPGSIAEREHLKWQNAEPMANNPYSTEALQRRLICGKTKPLDIHLLMDDKDQELGTEDNDAKTLQSVFSEDLTDYKRYGRDYYINDAKNASGSRKAFLESRTLTESETDSDAAKVVEVEKVSQTFAQSKQKRSNNVMPRNTAISSKSYIMEKFLNDNNHQLSSHPNNHLVIHRTPSLNLNLSHTDRNRSSSRNSDFDATSCRTMPVRLRNNYKRAMSVASNFEIPTRSFQQLEAGLLHGNINRASLRANRASKNFVLNPIFDEETPVNLPDDRSKNNGVIAIDSENVVKIECDKTDKSLRLHLDQPDMSVETVFDDLCQTRRWHSLKDLNSETASRRSVTSKGISNTLSGLW